MNSSALISLMLVSKLACYDQVSCSYIVRCYGCAVIKTKEYISEFKYSFLHPNKLHKMINSVWRQRGLHNIEKTASRVCVMQYNIYFAWFLFF